MIHVSHVRAGQRDWSEPSHDGLSQRFQGATARHRARPSGSLAILAADVVAFLAAAACAFVVAYPVHGSTWSLPSALLPGSPGHGPLLIAGAAAVAILAVFASNSHYTRRVPFWTELRDLVLASIVSLLFSGCAAFLLQQQGGRSFPALVWLGFPIFAVVLRKLVRWQLAASGAWRLRTLVVTPPESAPDTLAALETERQLGYEVVAVVNPDNLGAFPGSQRWSTLMQLHRADLLVLAYNGSAAPSSHSIQCLLRERVPFALMPQFEGLPVLGFEQTRFFSHDTVMFTFRNNLAKPVARFTKMAFDLAAATVGVIVLAPVLLILVLLVKRDGGPALYGHTRIGSGGRPFRCLKFRSMVVDSEGVLRNVLARDSELAAEWMQSRKLRNDPRITKIGRVLRATSLDELPQLFNVLRLEMSLVGPRPIVAAEVARYGDDISYYYETRPGLTGLWQVSGRTETSYAKRVQLDTWYVKNWTLWHDLAILAKTVPAVLQRRGAV